MVSRQGKLFDKAMGDALLGTGHSKLEVMFERQLELLTTMARMGKGPMFDGRSVMHFAWREGWAEVPKGGPRDAELQSDINCWLSSLKAMTTAMLMESAEMMDWLPWKHWKLEWELTPAEARAEVAVESVDMLHFIINIWMLLGMTPEQVFALYAAKNAENCRRATGGY